MVWTIINHPGTYLIPTTRALCGSIQDICWKGAPSVLINIEYYMDFLMEHFCVTENILQNNLFVIVQSVEITAVILVHAIMHISIGLPF